MLMRKKSWLMVLIAWAISQSAWAGVAKIKVISPANGEENALIDDHIVAVLSYERIETTQSCGGPKGQTQMLKIIVHADGSYAGTEVKSRLVCPRSGSVHREASQSKHTGKLAAADLIKFLDRVASISGQPRGIAAQAPDNPDAFQTTIRLSPDLRGALSEVQLPKVVQTGAAAKSSAQFMQSFMRTGKID